METSPRPLTELDPGVIAVLRQAALGAAEAVLWPVPKATRRRGVESHPGATRHALSASGSGQSVPPPEPSAEGEDSESEGDTTEAGPDDEAEEPSTNFDLLLRMEALERLEVESFGHVIQEPAGRGVPKVGGDAEPEEDAVSVPGPAGAGAPDAAANACGAEAATPARSVRGPSTAASAVIFLTGGKISYHVSKRGFEAVCNNKAHGHCVLSRTAKGRKVQGRMVGGRPLGFLACWLTQHHVESKKAHTDKQRMQFPREDRVRCRRELQDRLAGQELLAFERPKAEDEASEPEDLTGLL